MQSRLLSWKIIQVNKNKFARVCAVSCKKWRYFTQKSWYFDDTFLTFLQEVSFSLYTYISINYAILNSKRWYNDTFSLKKHYTCVRKWHFKERKRKEDAIVFFSKNNNLSTFTKKDLVVTNNCCNFVARFSIYQNNKKWQEKSNFKTWLRNTEKL